MSLATLLITLSSIFRSRAALQLENLALRHQIGVLQRSARQRPKLTAVDRLSWVWLSRSWSDWRSGLAIVQPDTVLAWRLAEYGPQSVVALTDPVQHESERLRLGELRQWPVQQVPLDLRRRPVLVGHIEDFDVLFHLAAYVRTEDDASDVRINDNGTRWLLEELGERLRNKHLVFTSSISAVDTTRAQDGWMDAGTECCPRTEYGRSKLNAEEIIKAESVRLGFTYSILRLPIVYGPGYRPGGMFGFCREQLPKKTLGS
ncbi:MAG: NAD(P)-dependent oxidoreductase [Candidatus Korobacteraceae bacterium]